VLWDRITYTGEAKDFAWVLPVTPGAKLETAAAAWIEAIVGGTKPVPQSPAVTCAPPPPPAPGCHCKGGDETPGTGGGNTFGESEGVTVVHRANVGPYDTVTIKSGMPGAIYKWLTDNGYAIPPEVQPFLDDYTAKGLEFLAVRFLPNTGVEDMVPLRVIMAGVVTTFPLPMLNAGANVKVPINLVALAEDPYEANSFANETISPAAVTWDFVGEKSDYDSVRSAVLAKNDGATWLAAFASNAGVLQPIPDIDGDPWGDNGLVTFSLDDKTSSHLLGLLYFQRGKSNGEGSLECSGDEWYIPGEVVELCADTSMPCGKLMPGQIDATTFACGSLTDLSTALVGMHAEKLHITRLEAELPVASLGADLTLVPSTTLTPLPHFVRATHAVGDPCTGARVVAPKRAAAPAGLLLVGFGLVVARRAGRVSTRSRSRR
jgi:hypothetical protein